MNRTRRNDLMSKVLMTATVLLVAGMLSTPAHAQAQCTGSPSQCGQWTAPVSWPVEAIHMNLLPNGDVLFWGPYPETATYLWNPVTDPTGATITSAGNDEYPGFCAGHVLLPNGQVIVLGGLQEPGLTGIPDARVYDYTTNTWSSNDILPDMTKPQANGQLTWPNGGRYYPTATALPSGDVLIISGNGRQTNLGVNTLPQIWNSSSPTCATQPIPSSPLPISCWIDLTTALKALPLYPKMFVAPNGQVFDAGPAPATQYLNISASCPASKPGQPPTAAPCWATPPFVTADTKTLGAQMRDYGPAAMYDGTAGKILLAGGGRPPSTATEIINLTASAPKWQWTGAMAYPRRQNNATILADGTVLVTGGTTSGVVCTGTSCSCPPGNLNNDATCMGFDDYDYPVFPAEVWNPSTGNWTVLASMTKYRGYHSGALLLPDGRVVTSGGDFSCVSAANLPYPVPGHCPVAPNPYTAEIFSPPYLFQGPRPTITSAPTNVTYGQQYTVQTPDAANITSVTFIRLGTVTHTFNENQRINFISFAPTSDGTGITITTPANSNLAPPGHYMLLILENGVPSVASIIQIQ